MEAKGHQEIIEEQLQLVERYLKELGLSDNELGCLYLGNWAADFSQILDEGPKKMLLEFLLLPNKMEVKIHSLIARIRKVNEQVSEEDFLSIPVLSITNPIANLIYEITIRRVVRAAFIKLAKNLLCTSVSSLTVLEKTLRSFEIQGLDLDHLNIEGIYGKEPDNKTPGNVSLQLADSILRNLVKAIGLKEFVLANPDKKIKLSPTVYERVVNVIMADKSYVPHEHLDRPFDYEIIKRLFNKAEWNERYFEVVAPICIDKNKRTTESYLYDYLQGNLELAFRKLIKSEFYFKNLKGKRIQFDKNTFHIELANLGNTLHTIEDFFAHSNFIDFSIMSAEKTFSRKNSANKYLHDFTAIEKKRIDRAIRELHDDKKNDKNADNKIATGFFAKEDMYVSFYHLFMGMLTSVSDLDSSLTPFNPEHYVDLYNLEKNKLLKEINEKKDLDDFLRSPNKIDYLKNNKKLIFVTQENVRNLFCKSPSASSGPLINEKYAPYICDIINAIVTLQIVGQLTTYAKDLKDLAKKITLIVDTVLAIIKIVILIEEFPKSVFRILKTALVPVAKFVSNEALKEYGKYVIEKIAVYIAEAIFGEKIASLEDRVGCHSILAKDEEYQKPNLHNIAMFLAKKMDSLIISNILDLHKDKNEDNSPEDSKQPDLKYINWQEVLSIYFKCGFMKADSLNEVNFQHKYMFIKDLSDTLKVGNKFVPVYKDEIMRMSANEKIKIPFTEEYMARVSKENMVRLLEELEVSASLKEVWYFFPYFVFDKEKVDKFLNYKIDTSNANHTKKMDEVVALFEEIKSEEDTLIRKYREISFKTTYFKKEVK